MCGRSWLVGMPTVSMLNVLRLVSTPGLRNGRSSGRKLSEPKISSDVKSRKRGARRPKVAGEHRMWVSAGRASEFHNLQTTEALQ
jgi:hypothetical protein